MCSWGFLYFDECLYNLVNVCSWWMCVGAGLSISVDASPLPWWMCRCWVGSLWAWRSSGASWERTRPSAATGAHSETSSYYLFLQQYLNSLSVSDMYRSTNILFTSHARCTIRCNNWIIFSGLVRHLMLKLHRSSSDGRLVPWILDHPQRTDTYTAPCPGHQSYHAQLDHFMRFDSYTLHNRSFSENFS